MIAASLAVAADALTDKRISARDLKTLDYVENAHGQLEEWTGRLYHRLENGLGPREHDPLLDGRADLQVQKISVTYAGYTHNAALADVLHELSAAEQKRLDAVRRMIDDGIDEKAWRDLSEPVHRYMTFLREWREQR